MNHTSLCLGVVRRLELEARKHIPPFLPRSSKRLGRVLQKRNAVSVRIKKPAPAILIRIRNVAAVGGMTRIRQHVKSSARSGRYCKDRRSSAHGRRMLLRKRIPLRHAFRLLRLYHALPLARFGCRHAIQYLADSTQYLFSSYSFSSPGTLSCSLAAPASHQRGS